MKGKSCLDLYDQMTLILKSGNQVSSREPLFSRPRKLRPISTGLRKSLRRWRRISMVDYRRIPKAKIKMTTRQRLACWWRIHWVNRRELSVATSRTSIGRDWGLSSVRPRTISVIELKMTTNSLKSSTGSDLTTQIFNQLLIRSLSIQRYVLPKATSRRSSCSMLRSIWWRILRKLLKP